MNSVLSNIRFVPFNRFRKGYNLPKQMRLMPSTLFALFGALSGAAFVDHNQTRSESVARYNSWEWNNAAADHESFHSIHDHDDSFEESDLI